MKVSIYTLYSAFNYGAFLQAYATQEKFRSLGHEASVVEFEPLAAKKARYRTLISKKFGTLRFNFGKFLAFRRAWKYLNIQSKSKLVSCDLAVLGSDEIWNVRNPTFKPLPEYFGVDINARAIVSYAPSSSDSTIEEIKSRSFAVEGLKRLTEISVRDENTFAITSVLTGRTPTMVLDPTFLLDWSEYAPKTLSSRYMVVYTYGLDPQRIEQIRNFANTHKLKTISPGFNNAWCDEVSAADPFEFLRLIAGAAYVATDTFHGTIFSIIFKRQFLSFASKKPKIQYLLKSLGLLDRVIDPGIDFELSMITPIDYDAVEMRRESLQRDSEAFIDRAVIAAWPAA